MTTLARIKNHNARSEATLTSAYVEKPNTVALLRAFVNRVQELEEAAWDVIQKRILVSETTESVPWEGGFGADVLADARGHQLDMLGSIVGEPRAGRSDIEYATAIRLRLRIARSSGTPDDLIQIGQLSYTGAVVEYYDEITSGFGYYMPATARISVAPSSGALGPLLRRAKPAGVRLEVLQSVSANGFRWGDAGGGVTAGRHTWANGYFGVAATARWGAGETL